MESESARSPHAAGEPERPWYGPEGRWKQLRTERDEARADLQQAREALEAARAKLEEASVEHKCPECFRAAEAAGAALESKGEEAT